MFFRDDFQTSITCEYEIVELFNYYVAAAKIRVVPIIYTLWVFVVLRNRYGCFRLGSQSALAGDGKEHTLIDVSVFTQVNYGVYASTRPTMPRLSSEGFGSSSEIVGSFEC